MGKKQHFFLQKMYSVVMVVTVATGLNGVCIARAFSES